MSEIVAITIATIVAILSGFVVGWVRGRRTERMEQERRYARRMVMR